MKIAVPALAVLVLVLAAGCGDDPATPAPPATPQARTKAGLLALFEAIRAPDNASAAERIVYRGADKTRAWTTLCNYTQPDEARRVDALCDRIRGWLGDTDPVFVKFRSERESEGEWLVWQVHGANATAWYACLDIDGTIALGDVDKD